MPIRGVSLTADAYSVCLTHALTTEKEEIMGLLIGEVSTDAYNLFCSNLSHIDTFMLKTEPTEVQ